MQPQNDGALLRRYAEHLSDEAFAALVARHVNLVYSVALRSVGNSHQAEEVTQAVFIILAKKARQLRHDKALSSWLFQTTRLTANNFLRSETRRHRREQEAYMQSTLNQPGSDHAWPQIADLLDTAVAALREKDRRAIVLRFYEGRNLREIGAVLGASEEGAKKRVARALEKLQSFFSKHGVHSTTALIAGAISANSVHPAPSALAISVTAAATAKCAAASASTLILVKGALKLMTWTKIKTAFITGAVLLLAAGAATIVITETQKQRHEPRRRQLLNRIGPVIKVSPNGSVSVLSGRKLDQMIQPGQSHGMPANGKAKWENALRRSQAIWADRQFLEVTNDGALRNAINALTGQLPLDSDAIVAANESCYRLLVAYSSGDWDAFKSVMIPSLSIPDAQSRKTWLDQYHTRWNATFRRGGLFNECSFTVDPLTVLDIPMDQIPNLHFPTFTAATNDNCITLTQLLNPNRADLKKMDKAKVLRFCFFGRAGSRVNLYTTIFVWNDQDSVWSPWLMRIADASVGQPRLNLDAF